MAAASKTYADLVQLATSSGKEYDLALIEKGYKFALEAHKEQERQSGEPYIIHPIAVACKLIEFGMDTPSVVAGLLHDVIEDTSYTYDEIAKLFGKEIANLTEGRHKARQDPVLLARGAAGGKPQKNADGDVGGHPRHHH